MKKLTKLNFRFVSSPRDPNRVVAIMGVSTTDGVTPVPIQVNPATGAVLVTIV